MDFFLTFLGGTIGVLFGALLVKLYLDWKERKEQKAFNEYLAQLQKELDELYKQPDEVTKPIISDPPEPVDRPL